MPPFRIALLCLLVLSCPAAAQPAASFSDLVRRLDRGDRVVVEAGTEAPLEATVVVLTPESLRVRVDGDGERTFTAVEVRRVVRKGDSLSNGLTWGLAIGLSLGCVTSVAFVDGGSWRDCPIGGLLLGSFFAGGAVLLDYAHDGATEVYRAPPAVTVDRPRGGRVMAHLVWRW